jgi:hypothetical protein
MRVKVEDDSGELLALIHVPDPDERGVISWTCYRHGGERQGEVWAQLTPMQNVGLVMSRVLARG